MGVVTANHPQNRQCPVGRTSHPPVPSLGLSPTTNSSRLGWHNETSASVRPCGASKSHGSFCRSAQTRAWLRPTALKTGGARLGAIRTTCAVAWALADHKFKLLRLAQRNIRYRAAARCFQKSPFVSPYSADMHVVTANRPQNQ